jgi:RimJ/RimL family protein N-acetyltransferase
VARASYELKNQVNQVAHAKQALPTFHTERFVVTPPTPAKLRELAQVLLKDERLAGQLPWMQEKSADGAEQEAFLLELQCASGTTKAWGIVERARAIFIGAVLARHTLGGIDLEVLCASGFWNHGVADEVGEPVGTWLEDSVDVQIGVAH